MEIDIYVGIDMQHGVYRKSSGIYVYDMSIKCLNMYI